MKKVLIITYYWPPMGGGGVQRWLKFVKYLRECGWEPVIFTAEGGKGGIPDEGLLEEVPAEVEVIRHPILEPYTIYNLLLGKRRSEGAHPGFIDTEGKKGKGWLKRLSMWIRASVFIPDARMLWITPSSRKLKGLLKERDDIELLLSTGPPHSTHLIAQKVRQSIGLPWVADFRDPWTEIDHFHKLPMAFWAKGLHKKLERKVLQGADRVITVSWSWAEGLERIGGRRVDVVTNGYDEADFKGERTAMTRTFSITHAGAFNQDRNPPFFWEGLKELCEEEDGFREALSVRSIGPTDRSVIDSIDRNGLSSNFEHISSLPHQKVIPYLVSSWLLFLPLNDTPNINGVIPGKFYEYLGAERPILCTGKKDCDVAHIIARTRCGEIFDDQDKKGIKEFLRTAYRFYLEGKLLTHPTNTEQYTRRVLAGEIAGILNEVSTKE